MADFVARDYQAEARNAFINSLVSEKNTNPLVVLPQGTGKSIVIADVIKSLLWHFPQTKIIMSTHVQELVAQNAEKLKAMVPNISFGIYSAGLGKKEYGHSVIYGSIQSMVKRPELFAGTHLVLVDEAHLVNDKEDTMYQTFFNALRNGIEGDFKGVPGIRIGGFTATPFRQKMGLLTEGRLFTHTCYDKSKMNDFNWFIDQGYLVPLIPRPTSVEIDTSSVRITGGDFNAKDLDMVSNKDEITWEACKEVLDLGRDRKKWLCFGTSIDHVEKITFMFQRLDIDARFVHSKMSKKDRVENIRAYRNNEFTAMVNQNILSTGYDDPYVDMIVDLAPTRSPGKHTQKLGRGTRPLYAPGFDLALQEGRLAAISASDKLNCLVLDFAGNVPRCGPINDPRIPKRRTKGPPGEMPVKICSEGKLLENTGSWPDGCYTYNNTVAKTCVGCGGQFIFRTDLNEHSGEAVIIAKTEAEIVRFNVDRVTYLTHSKKNAPLTMKVSYHCGMRRFVEYICLDHDGFASKRARDWCRARLNGIVPNDTAEAVELADEFLVPSSIDVDVARKWPEIINGNFNKENA